MGCFVSTIAKDIDDVVSTVSTLVTDAGKTVEQLTSIASGLQPGAPGPKFLDSLADAQDVNGAMKTTMNQAQAASKKLFEKDFSGVDIAGTDKGVVKDYCPDCGDDEAVIGQLKVVFKNKGLPLDPKPIAEMATTIREEVKAQMGVSGTASGHYNINTNQKIDWTVAYGMFEITPKSQGLIYAFSVALDGGFG